MNVLIPMAGEGKRFQEAGYEDHKAVLPMIYRKTGEECPMVVCSVMDLPGVEKDGRNVTFVIRDFHVRDGTDARIRKWYPAASFRVVRRLTEGQACTCLLASDRIGREEELLIAACDNGIDYDEALFDRLRAESDMLVFTCRRNTRASEHPDDFGWVYADASGRIAGVSVKKRISEAPENDPAIVATFWFRRGGLFLDAAERMIRQNDRINGEFYVDEVVRHALELGACVRTFDVDRFLNYGTPEDYETYGRTVEHFRSFVRSPFFLEV